MDDLRARGAVRLDHDAVAPRKPFYFLAKALRGTFTFKTLPFVLAWLAFQGLTSLAWAVHLRELAGSSALPTYWGELLTARDVWEMVEHGGLKSHPVGVWTSLALVGSLVWILWSGWRLQAEQAGVPPRVGPWLVGMVEAMILALLPLGLLRWVLMGALSLFASTGIQSLGWVEWIGGALAQLVLGQFLMIQWWLCRLDRAQPGSTWFKHMGHSFVRLWLHPSQWGLLALVGALVRGGLMCLVLALAWRWGGGSGGKVSLAAGLLGLATCVNAWLIAWQMGVVAHFWRQDRRVRDEVQRLVDPDAGVV